MSAAIRYHPFPLAGLATTLLLLLVALPAMAAGPITASQWTTYTNNRYGVLIDYPANLFKADPPPPNNAGRNFEAPAVRARFYVDSHANALDLAPAALEAEELSDLGGTVVHKQNGKDWYQIVTVKGDETVVRRVLLSEEGSMIHRLEIGYPTDAATAFAPIVARMTKSFRVDPALLQ